MNKLNDTESQFTERKNRNRLSNIQWKIGILIFLISTLIFWSTFSFKVLNKSSDGKNLLKRGIDLLGGNGNKFVGASNNNPSSSSFSSKTIKTTSAAARSVATSTSSTKLTSTPTATPTATPISKFYSSVVAFGDSYSDNAHARPNAWNPTLQHNYNQGGGRSSNGPVAVEWMVSNTTSPSLGNGKTLINLFNYALGGTVINNTLVSNQFPDLSLQIQQFLNELNSKSISLGSERNLISIFDGLNVIYPVFVEAMNGNLSNEAVQRAMDRMNANALSLASSVKFLQSSPILKKANQQVDFLIVGLPSLQYNPFFWFAARNGDSKSLAVLDKLQLQFNSQLQVLVSDLKPVAKSGGGKVFYGDFNSLWTDFSTRPARYGFDKNPWVFQTCWDYNGSVCERPAEHLMWDTLHPTTTAHSFIANAWNSLVMS